MRIIQTIGLAALILTAATPASAEQPETRAVKTNDLNLASADDVRRLNRRILDAVTAICAQGLQTRRIASPAERACRATAGHDAFEQVAAIRQSHQTIQVASR